MAEQFPNNQEKSIIQLTAEEYGKYSSMSTDNPELLDWMQEKGISFDQGMIDVEIDGKKTQINSNKSDFGTGTYEN